MRCGAVDLDGTPWGSSCVGSERRPSPNRCRAVTSSGSGRLQRRRLRPPTDRWRRDRGNAMSAAMVPSTSLRVSGFIVTSQDGRLSTRTAGDRGWCRACTRFKRIGCSPSEAVLLALAFHQVPRRASVRAKRRTSRVPPEPPPKIGKLTGRGSSRSRCTDQAPRRASPSRARHDRERERHGEQALGERCATPNDKRSIQEIGREGPEDGDPLPVARRSWRYARTV
jgi:hypothetical protein